ncbi:chlorophyll synthase ChlG [Chloracidobacterium validum]|uniref:chlorophyll synthase ChlG n=1 Tax=Chloracidobacterium validum TaxID=2821543 RepID=UPI001FEA9867|nr:chlorophyll synthase ChlG [Chloracidobacterium validum]
MWLVKEGVVPSSSFRLSKTASPASTPMRRKVSAWIELLKPVTWIPIMCAYVAGALCSAKFTTASLADWRLWLGLVMSGPLISGTCQAMNDYFDRDVDAINEPYRPIPSGRISLREATLGISLLCGLTLVAAYLIHPWIVALAVIGIVNAHLYSAKPIKLKRIVWVGNATVAASYILLPWMSGELAFKGQISWTATAVAVCYVIASIGSMTTNDFKSLEGDARMAIHTLPQVFGVRRGAWLGVFVLNAGQLAAAGLLATLGEWGWAGLVGATVLPQMWFQRTFLADPIGKAVWYNAHAQGFLVLGMFLAAWAVRA